MRIIQVIHSLTFGGAENHCVTLSQKLIKRGHHVLLVAPKNSWIEDQCLNREIPFSPLAMRGIADVLSYIKLHFLIRFFNADICHAHQVRPSQYVGIATKMTRAIPISTVHSTNVKNHMSECKHLIAVADAVVDNLLKNGFSKEIITRIYNGIDPVPLKKRKDVRQELNIPDNQFAVVTAGRFHPDKGFDKLIRIADKLKTVHFYFLGDDSTDYAKTLKKSSERLENVHFLGYRSDVQVILSGFDLYAAPSRREAFSLVLLEAECAGLPIVSHRVGGIPEAVINGKNGILVDKEDEQGLLESIKRCSQDLILCQEMGQKGRERFLENFTVDKMVEETEAVYQKLLLEKH